MSSYGQDDDLGCLATIGCLVIVLAMILTLSRAAVWALETLSGA